MLCLPIPGIEVARVPGCLGNTFGGEAAVRALSGGPPGAEVSLCASGEGNAGLIIFGDPCFGASGGDAFPRTGVRCRSSDGKRTR